MTCSYALHRPSSLAEHLIRPARRDHLSLPLVDAAMSLAAGRADLLGTDLGSVCRLMQTGVRRAAVG